MNYREIAENVKRDSNKMMTTTGDLRNSALAKIKTALKDNADKIFEANKKDLQFAEENNVPAPILSRLKFDEHKLETCLDGISDLINLEDPLNKILLKRELDTDLTLTKITCPIGVIGIIFEARPDALVQISTLCVKSGNCSILKGGSEAKNTNKILFDTIYEAGIAAGLPNGFATLIEDRSAIDDLLKCHESIDLIIPRGSNEFVQYIMANSKIPVMGHADGICHIYVDKEADIPMALKIIEDSKTQYVAACNTVETLLVHKDIYDEIVPHITSKISLKEGNFGIEYLDYILSVMAVEGLNEAISHINKYGSHHTDCIITQNDETAEYFMNYVDSAGVYQNCSTRFADGYRYGFGAEVGISTGKLHARGPVGIEGLVTYKYKLKGNGQIVKPYASGEKHFNFKDL